MLVERLRSEVTLMTSHLGIPSEIPTFIDRRSAGSRQQARARDFWLPGTSTTNTGADGFDGDGF